MTGLTGKLIELVSALTNLHDSGLFWNAFMVDNNNLYFIASWDTAQMNDTEIEEHCDSLADVMRKLADERRWGKKVEEVFGL